MQQVKRSHFISSHPLGPLLLLLFSLLSCYRIATNNNIFISLHLAVASNFAIKLKPQAGASLAVLAIWADTSKQASERASKKPDSSSIYNRDGLFVTIFQNFHQPQLVSLEAHRNTNTYDDDDNNNNNRHSRSRVQ